MATQPVTSVNCPNCRTPFSAPVYQIVDTQREPEVKSLLLAGQLNSVVCPHCGFQGALNTPFLYHDRELELALIYMPMEMGSTDLERQKAIGNLTNQVMNQLPAEAPRGYLLQPKVFFSQENLVNALLEADEETREIVETQRRKMELLDQLRQVDPQDNLAVAEFVGTHDEELDVLFFQLLDMVISVAESQGDPAEYERLRQHRESLLEKSQRGQLFLAQQEAVEALAADPTRENLLEQLVAAADRSVKESLIMVGRQLLDYAFFQNLTARIEAAEENGDEPTKEKLVSLRKEIQEIRDEVDAMMMAVMESRAQLLAELLSADNPREMVMQRLGEIDNAFFQVLSSNIYQAEQEGQPEVAVRLRQIGDLIVDLLNELAPPEIRLINRLAAAESNEEVERLLADVQEPLDDAFLEILDRAVTDLQQRGLDEGVERLRYAAKQIEERIAA